MYNTKHKPNGNSQLYLIILHQYRFIYGKRQVTVVQDVRSGEGCVCVCVFENEGVYKLCNFHLILLWT